ncbi:UNVERIFIED_CONTAM: hypothetical protein Sradi_2647400 [Sesamum radiatum]|uniref:Reverse transcriptase n=1 Tax=Sesamum radiatum TaxID=300843 RepID=A0AAW2S7I0_SESRA
MDRDNLGDGLTDEERRFLCVMPTWEEVREAIFSIEPDSVAEPDGFGAIFYHTYWDVISQDVFDTVAEFFRCVEMPKGFTTTTISLILKIASPTSWSEYRPISLCNVTKKICMKLMIIRLGHILPKNMELLRDFLWAYQQVSGQLINGTKSSFIVGRQVSSLRTRSVQNVMGYQFKHLPVTYLGVPLHKGI